MLASRAASSAGVQARSSHISRNSSSTCDHRLPRADRVAGDQRVAADVGVGEERLAVAGEEEVLVVAQREVGQRVPAVGVHEPRGVLPVVLGVRGARGQRPEQQDREHDQARRRPARPAPPGSRPRRTATGRCTGRRARRGRRTPSPAHRRCSSAGVIRLRSGPERDDAEHQHGDQVQRHEPDEAEQRRRVDRRAEGPPVGDQRDQHADAERQRDRVRPLDQVREGADREQRHRDPPGRVFALAELVGQQDQQQPDDHRHDVADDRHPQRPDARPSRASNRECTNGIMLSSWSTPQSAVSPAIVRTARGCSVGPGRRVARWRAWTGPWPAGRRRMPGPLPSAARTGDAARRDGRRGGQRAWRPARPATRRRGELGAQRREEDHLADRVDAGQQHHQPVDPDAEPARAAACPCSSARM